MHANVYYLLFLLDWLPYFESHRSAGRQTLYKIIKSGPFLHCTSPYTTATCTQQEHLYYITDFGITNLEKSRAFSPKLRIRLNLLEEIWRVASDRTSLGQTLKTTFHPSGQVTTTVTEDYGYCQQQQTTRSRVPDYSSCILLAFPRLPTKRTPKTLTKLVTTWSDILTPPKTFFLYQPNPVQTNPQKTWQIL